MPIQSRCVHVEQWSRILIRRHGTRRPSDGRRVDEDGEQYRVILNDGLVATFTVVEDAVDFYTEHAR
jgi:hypothetical protein